MKSVVYIFVILLFSFLTKAQKDSIPFDKKLYNLDEVEIKVQKDNDFGISRLNSVEGVMILAGKKTEAVYVQDLNANLATNNSRQLFSKVAGINIFENDGSGTQIGVGGRGLNPNRVSNFNTRQNGYDISADALGYPESYYTPPTEAIERIEILRGAAGLQFGTQFGGLINYKFRQAPMNKKISGLFRQTVASYGLFNSFNQIGGTLGHVRYNGFYQYKTYDGWKDRTSLVSHNAFCSVELVKCARFSIGFEYTHLKYLSEQPGGLTDKQFLSEPSIVNRSRNWFKVNWNLMSLNANYQISESAKMNLMIFGLNASRDALGYLGRIDRPDDTSANRNLLADTYNNIGSELRLLKRYNLFGLNSHFLIGTRYYRGNTIRNQGDASKGGDPDFKFINPENLENSSYEFPSENISVFMENIFQINRKWSITPGARLEYISTNSKGYYRLLNKDLAGNVLLDMQIADNRSNNRYVYLFGLGNQFKVNENLECYLNFSQNYRSINFNDMRVANPNFQVNPDLKDEHGYTIDGGLRGIIKNVLYYDLSVFNLMYKDRIGTVLATDSITYQIIRYRTNVSDSRNVGVEAFAELDWMKLINKDSKHKLSTFLNGSYINARYINSKQSAYLNKFVEYVPEIIVRTGINYGFKGLKLNVQYSYTSQQYSDATNSESSPSAIFGVIPAYTVMDAGLSYEFKKFTFITGSNNLLNASYFTRRAEGYPGPGILPSDPRSFYFTLQFKF